jgi:hypothetical protein
MISYRFFRLHDDRNVIGHETRGCKDDLSALDVAWTLCAKSAVEIWDGLRIVAHVNRGGIDHTCAQAQPG